MTLKRSVLPLLLPTAKRLGHRPRAERKYMPGYAGWEIHPVMALQVEQ
jgi:hypothetical protein